jgi:hypothetical protein
MRRNIKKQCPYGRSLRLSRRHLLAGAASAAMVSTVGAVSLVHAASQTARQSARLTRSPLPVPSPIPGGIEVPDVGFVHGFVSGPEGSITPFVGVPARGWTLSPARSPTTRGSRPLRFSLGKP